MQQALAIQQAMNDRRGEGVTFHNIGLVYRALERYANALDAYQQALTIEREIGDRRGEGVTLQTIGAVYHAQARYSKALDAYQQALIIARESGNRPIEGIIFNNIGLLYDEQAHYAQALDYYQQALATTRDIGDRATEGITVENIGDLYRRQGNYGQALRILQQALTIQRALGDHLNEARILNSLGILYQEQGRNAEALDYFQQALMIRRAAGAHQDQGITLDNIGVSYQKQGHYDAALEAHLQALAIMREVGDRIDESITLNNIAELYSTQGQYAKALSYFQQVLSTAHESGQRRLEGTTLNNIAGVYYHQENYTEALNYGLQALKIMREVGDRINEGIALDNIGAAHQALGLANKAIIDYSQAMDVLEAVRATVTSEQGRASFIAQYSTLYERAALLYHQQGEDDQALLASERGRARAFLDSLATGQVQLSDDDASRLLEQEREAYIALQTTQDALARARAASPPDTAAVADLEQQLTDVEKSLATAREAIAVRNDQLVALIPGRTQRLLDRTAVQKHLDSQTTLISYFVSEQQTLAFVLTHDHFQTILLPVGRAALHDQVRAVLDSPAFEEQAHPPEAITLYHTLIAPLKQFLTTQNLAIIPHGPLHYLPWAALSNGTRYLADDYIVTTLPSASVLPFIQANTKRSPAPPLILGNPDGTLRFAEHEARTVANLYGVQPLIGNQATKDALQKRVGEAGIVHLATHAAFDPNVPLASSITLAPTVTSTVQLEASEVYALDLHKADLVVLSACQTNLGEVSLLGVGFYIKA